MAPKWKEKKKAKKQQEKVLAREEAERERIRRYNRAYRKTHLAETAARQRRWRAKKGSKSSIIGSDERVRSLGQTV